MQGFTEKKLKPKNPEKVPLKSGEEYLTSHESPLRFIEQFIGSLAQPDADGRIIVVKTDDTKSLQYILLNPSEIFEPIVTQSRSVILAGGTMAPIADFISELLPSVKENDIYTFSCGHVIPKNQLLPICLPFGPSGKPSHLSYEQRKQANTIQEMGQAILNLTVVIPTGVVVFFGSYAYMNFVYEQWKKSGLIDRLSKRKHVFVEPVSSIETEATLRQFVHCNGIKSQQQVHNV